MSPRNAQVSRDRLVESAADLFYRHGIHRTSIDAIVAEAGLTKPTLYSHFASKDELVAAVVQVRSDNWHEAIEERIAAARTPATRLLAVFDFLEDFIAEDNFRGCALVNASVEILSPSSPGREIARSNKAANRERIRRLASDAGLNRARSLAESLSLLFEGAIVSAHVEGDRSAGNQARRAARALIAAHSAKPS